MRRRGNCYVASEALYHALGGKRAGWTPMRMRVPGDTHWFLRHASGVIVDPSRQQFRKPLDYSKARGAGFLTRRPSKRARILLDTLTFQGDA